MTEEQVEAAALPDAAGSRGGLLLFIALSVANAGNYLFQVVASRLLGPADYSLMGGIFAIITVIGVSTSSLQTASAKMAASSPLRAPVPVHRDPLVLRVVKVTLPLVLLAALLSPLVAMFLRSGIAPALLLGLYLIEAPLLSIGFGRLQGLQSFSAFAYVSLGLAGGRLVLTVAVLALGWGVTGVVGASFAVTAVGAWIALQLSQRAYAVPSREMWQDTARATAALVVFWVMVSADVPVARHGLDAEAAGQYTAASVIGKAVLWLPGAISLIMFPKVARARETGELTHPHLLRSLFLTVGLCILAVIAMWVGGPTLIPVVFGSQYSPGAEIAWQVGAVCIPFAIANLLIFYHLTRASSDFLVALVIGLILEVVALVSLHGSVSGIISSMGLASGAVVLGLVGPGTFRRLRDYARAGAV